MSSFYTPDELKTLGLGSYGENVLISRYASLYGAGNMHFGNNVRIDDFCILSGKIIMGNYIHISAYTGIWGGDSGVVLEDYSGISSRCAVYAESDDFSGKGMTNPMLPDELRNVIHGEVILKKHVLVGSGCTVLPGVTIGEGSSVGSMSLVKHSLAPWGVYAGIPCNRIKERDKNLLNLESLLF